MYRVSRACRTDTTRLWVLKKNILKKLRVDGSKKVYFLKCVATTFVSDIKQISKNRAERKKGIDKTEVDCIDQHGRYHNNIARAQSSSVPYD